MAETYQSRKRFATAATSTMRPLTRPTSVEEAKAESRAITRQLDGPHGLTNEERRALWTNVSDWNGCLTSGSYSPIPVPHLDERKEKAKDESAMSVERKARSDQFAKW